MYSHIIIVATTAQNVHVVICLILCTSRSECQFSNGHMMSNRCIQRENLLPLGMQNTAHRYWTRLASDRHQVMARCTRQITLCKANRGYRILDFQNIRAVIPTEWCVAFICLSTLPYGTFTVTRARRKERRIMWPVTCPNDASMNAVQLGCRCDKTEIASGLLAAWYTITFEKRPPAVTWNAKQISIIGWELHLSDGQLMSGQFLLLFPSLSVPLNNRKINIITMQKVLII